MKTFLTVAVTAGFLNFGGFACDKSDTGPGENDQTGEERSDEDFSMITPYFNESDMLPVNEAFSTTAVCPWGFVHNGVDFFGDGDGKPFRAAEAGTVDRIDFFKNEGNEHWQVNLDLEYNGRFRLGYAFEPMSSDSAAGAIQRSWIRVSLGQELAQGDTLGILHYGAGGAHVHFGFFDGNETVCPDSFFTPEARESILRLIRENWSNAEMCYPGQ
jgi:hypothetical protein